MNRFTQIDSFGKWIIEQKFDSDRKEVFCRASMTGYGTWFGEKIRLGMNDEIIFPTDDSKKIVPNLTQIEIVRKLLDKCRAGLLYLPN
ncbi:hypothetical protein EV11_0499 [Prochlorococcus sp. SS52]|nr:hypothetical protein EV04_1170 [Prochlorococcus marinus str. LG]KGG21435.1 hypothetical protein EV08_0520 [Prochlorococcus marinus str. SS2]KGG36719.1 hypothetical protein EV11_0499 [Prochlorococcus sp. SS52]